MSSIRSVDFGNVAAHAGNAVDDLFSGFGDQQAAGSYRTTAKYARENAQLEQESLDIKQAQLNRQIYTTIGGQKADVASAGFSASGSALDLMRDSAAQGALAKAGLNVQGAIAISNDKAQAEAADKQADAEDTAATGNFIGTALEIGAMLLPFLLML